MLKSNSNRPQRSRTPTAITNPSDDDGEEEATVTVVRLIVQGIKPDDNIVLRTYDDHLPMCIAVENNLCMEYGSRNPYTSLVHAPSHSPTTVDSPPSPPLAPSESPPGVPFVTPSSIFSPPYEAPTPSSSQNGNALNGFTIIGFVVIFAAILLM
ncbi:hypothetical protein HKD37_08G023176 [Glycine soja]